MNGRIFVRASVLMLFVSFPLMALPVDEPDWHIDTRIELASVLCRLAGYEEYQDVRIPAYDKAINEYFAPYRNHEAVRLMARLRKERGISHSAVPDLAMMASDARSWKPRVSLHPLPSYLDSRWDEASAKAFLKAARQFAKDTRAETFFRTQAGFYSMIERACREQFAGKLDLAWHQNHFRVPKGSSFHVIPGPLNGAASYGTHVVLPGGGMELNAVLSLPAFREGEPITFAVVDIEALLVHEFSHPFVNPWVDGHSDSLRPAAEKLFAEMQQTLRESAYSNWQSMMYESLVRAATIRYFLDHGNPPIASLSGQEDRSKGFWWTEDLARVFAAEGNQPITLDGIEPQVRAFFTEWAAEAPQRIAAKKAEIAAKGPQIVSLSPRDGDMEVDVNVGLLELRFDRPMARTWSIRGDAPDPIARPAWDETKTVLRIPVKMRPGQKYIIFLNKVEADAGFRSEAGERLTPQAWQFKVKE